jgi:recombination protein RecT
VTSKAGAALAVRSQNQEAAPAERALMDDIRRMEPEYQAAMPRGIEAVQLTRDAFTLLRNTPKLGECNRVSVLGGLMTIAQLGLRAGVLGHSYLLPFWNRNGGPKDDRGNPRGEMVAQLVVGYRGYVELAHRSPLVAGFSARTAFEHDEFAVRLGTAEEIVHVPHLEGDRGKPIAYYAVVKFANGGFTFRYKTAAEMRNHRDRYAKSPAKGPWKTQFNEMGEKTMSRDVSKYVPQATALQAAVAVDESVRMNLDVDTPPAEAATFVDGEVVEPEPSGDAGSESVEEPPGW